MSLVVVNGQDNAPMLAPLRMAALARREGGDEAVDRLYQALGQALHEGGRDLRRPGEAEAAIRAALEAGGFPPDLLPRAMTDQSTLDEVTRETREAQEGCGAYGVPWLVLGDRAFGFHGPVIAEVPRGQEAEELWEHTSWLLVRPYFYEMKRERDQQHA